MDAGKIVKTSAMSRLTRYLEAMDIRVWVRRELEEEKPKRKAQAAPSVSPPSGDMRSPPDRSGGNTKISQLLPNKPTETAKRPVAAPRQTPSASLSRLREDIFSKEEAKRPQPKETERPQPSDGVPPHIKAEAERPQPEEAERPQPEETERPQPSDDVPSYIAEQIPSLDFDRFEPVFDAEPAFFSEAREDNVQTLGWDALQARVEKCRACALHKTRTQVVFGCGNQKAGWLLAGEAPGYDEDIQGEPFVGRAGQLLNAMLRAIELKREDIYIANILKCRPPDNRNPEIAEMLSCGAYLERQISLVRPQLILATGSVSARHLLQTDTPIGRLRGTVYKYRDTGIPVVVMYHPAYLLRRPGEKAKAWQDLQLACRTAPVERNL